MYSREELKQLKKAFWEGFGDYASMLPELKHRKSKFVLYNTKVKGVELKFDANREGAFVILEINHKVQAERERLYAHFERYKVILEEEFPEKLIWRPEFRRESGEMVARIYTQKPNIDIHRQAQWKDFYPFMAEEMMKLERAFLTLKDTLEG